MDFDTSTKSLSIVMPTYNEEKRLPATLDKLGEWLVSTQRQKTEVLIIDDGSHDQTIKIAQNYAEKLREIVTIRVIQIAHVGYMNAVLTGMKQALNPFVGVLEADAPVHPRVFDRFLELMDKYDIICGSRLLKQEHYSTTGKPLLRRIFSQAMSLASRILFKAQILDPQMGFKLYRKTCLDAVLPTLRSKHDGMKSTEILMRAYGSGFSIFETPVDYHHDEDSKCVPKGQEFKVAIGALKGLLMLWQSMREDFLAGKFKRKPIRDIRSLFLNLDSSQN